MPEISVIVPVYNVEIYLTGLLDSVKNQTFTDFEVILVDDGSTDRSGLICDDCVKSDARFSAIHISNRGVSNARNIGIQTATGNYIAFLDGDDWIEPTYFEELFSIISENNADISVVGFIKREDDRDIPITLPQTTLKGKEALNQIGDPEHPWVSWPWGKLYIASVIKENNILFDDSISICEDSLFNVQVFQYAKKIVLSEKCLYNYRIRSSSATRSSYKELEKLYSKVIAFEKILSIANNYPGSTFENRTKSIIFTSCIYYITTIYRKIGYNAGETVRIKKKLKEFSRNLNMKTISKGTKIKWYILNASPKLLCLIEKRRARD